ncbi:MAG: anti-sigma factor family protein [Gemmatimonadales bacterium]
MSHVDRDTLNAYLDGETESGSSEFRDLELHISACRECRAALEDERRVRDRAAKILALSGPRDIAVPPFAEVLRLRRDRVSPAGVRRLGGMRTVAWAATIVLAVGAGWYARSTFTRSDMVLRRDEAPARDAGAVVALEQEPSVATVEEDRATMPSERSETAIAPRRQNEKQSPSENVAVPAPLADASGAGRGKIAEPGQPAFAEAIQPSELRGGLAARKAAADEAARRVGVTAVNAPAPGPESLVWTRVDEAAVRASLEGDIPVIQDVEVLDYATTKSSGQRSVLIRQKLDAATVLELIVQRVGATDRLGRAREESKTAQQMQGALRRDATNRAVSLRDGYRLTLSGALPVDSLRALLRRVRIP